MKTELHLHVILPISCRPSLFIFIYFIFLFLLFTQPCSLKEGDTEQQRIQRQCAGETGLSLPTNGLRFIVEPTHQLNMNDMLGGECKLKETDSRTFCNFIRGLRPRVSLIYTPKNSLYKSS